MLFERKTKDEAWWQMLSLPLVVVIIFFAVMAAFGPTIAFYALAGIYVVLSVYPMLVFFKMKNTGYLIQSAFFIAVSVVCLLTPSAIDKGPAVRFIPFGLFFMYVTMLMMFYQFINRKIKWRGLEVLELAGMTVEGSGSGYTPRPHPIAKINISQTELARFTDFVTRELVSLVFYDEDSIFFVPVVGMMEFPYMLGIKKDYIDETWMALDAEGNLSVHISQKDYLRYKMDLDFGRLCESLGDVFTEFIQLSQEGKEGRIIDKMNALRLPIFS